MNADTLQRAITLGKKTQHFFMALVGGDGFPYVTSARRIDRVADNQFAVEEWICPLTVKHLSENPKMAVLIWDPASDDGYELFGDVMMFEGLSFLNGFVPEAEESAYVPQVKRRLIVRAEKIAAFSHALHCDDIQLLTVARPPAETPPHQDTDAEVSVCGFAPEWAEHARFDRDDAPCDDGRAGRVHATGGHGTVGSGRRSFSQGPPPDIPVLATSRALAERRSAMEAKENRDVSTAPAAEADADTECLTDCCVCCCCDTEEECSLEG